MSVNMERKQVLLKKIRGRQRITKVEVMIVCVCVVGGGGSVETDGNIADDWVVI